MYTDIFCVKRYASSLPNTTSHTTLTHKRAPMDALRYNAIWMILKANTLDLI